MGFNTQDYNFNKLGSSFDDKENSNTKTHCLQTLFLLFKCVTGETNFVSRTNALLVGTFISVSDVSMSTATVNMPTFDILY